MRSVRDFPRRRPRPQRGRVFLLAVVAVVFLLAVSLRGIAGFYTDFLWFDSLHLSGVWTEILGAKIALAAVFTVAFAAVLWVNLVIADRLAPAFRVAGPEEEIVERYHEVIGGRTGLVRAVITLALALIAGVGTSAQWNEWILFRNKTSFDVTDALFKKDVGFYVFQLPFLKFLVDWAFASLVIILIVTAVAHYLNGGIRVQTPTVPRVTPQVKAHLSVILGALALLKAVGYWLQRYELTFSTRGVVDGASYTDVKAQLPALNLLVLISIVAFVLLLVNIRLRGWTLPIIAVGLWAFTSVVVGAVYPAFVQKFRVEPNESARERTYIRRNIDATRSAFRLADVKVREFNYDTALDGGGLDDNAATIRNVRLWDPTILQKTYSQLQEIRRFYRFNDVDIDRYEIDGETTQVMVAARELDASGVRPQSWQNLHLNFTHGFGNVVSAANAVTSNGLPDFLVQDLPPEGDANLKPEQPGIYFGQGFGGYAIVNTRLKETDYQTDEGTIRTTYKGTGGVKLSSWIRRAAMAARFGDLNPLISNYLKSDSRAIYIRDIGERVRKVAPFLRYDADPYPVVIDGRIKWIQDAYTTTSRYPYAQRAELGNLPAGSGLNGRFNYVRNSVKVVIDAYDGDLTFYVIDGQDPIARAYMRAFPKLFTDKDIPSAVREHIRYPEDLFRVQTNMYGRYHITDPDDFYDKGDEWEIARDPSSGRVASAPTTSATTTVAATPDAQPVDSTRRIDPYYLLMRLPQEENESFLLLRPFTPAGKNLLASFMVAKSDPSDYGQIEVFVMPRDQAVQGPVQVDARITAEPSLSRDISLLNQSGSQVENGSLQVVPINNSLLYVRPLYVQAQDNPVPSLWRVAVVFGDRVASAPTLKGALTQLFGSSPDTREQERGGGTTVTPSEPNQPNQPSQPGGADVASLLDQAAAAYQRAQDALKAGDLAGYQKAVDEMSKLIAEARQRSTPATSTTTTTAPASA